VARQLFEVLEHPIIGRHAVPRVPYRLAGTALSFRRPAPTLGQHTDEVLAERLGLTHDELAALSEAGVTGTRPTNL
jgi:crotonobetainyl-CoA:carnitine CoA-transferase CaiB-like acyl-CoA transferase